MKTRKGETSRQRRKKRKADDQEILKQVQAGMNPDSLYPDNEDEKIVEKDSDSDVPTSISELLEVTDDGDPPPELDPEIIQEKEVEEVDEVVPVVEDEPTEETIVEEIKENPADVVREIIGVTQTEEKQIDEFDYDLAFAEVLLAMTDYSIGAKVKDFLSNLSDKAPSLDTEDGVRRELIKAIKLLKADDEKVRETLPALFEAAKAVGIGQPSEKVNNAIIVNKDKEGNYRFVGWVTGKWIDLEKEILPESAHVEFENFLKENEDWQISFRSWHVPGSEREYPLDFWTYEKGFVIVSGKLTEPEAQRLMNAMKKQRLGMSHGFFGIRDENDNRIIRKYRTFEVSDLPLDSAAFPWSDLNTLMEAKSMKTQLNYLSEAVGEDKLKKILEDTELKQHILTATGIEEKQIDAFLAGEEVEVEPEEETKEVEQETAPELTDDMVELLKTSLGLQDVDLSEIKETLEKATATMAILPAIVKQVDDLSSQLQEKEKTGNELLAEMLSGNIGKRKSLEEARASNRKDNEPTEEELEKATPKHENSWLADMAGVEPVSKS